MSKDPFLLGEEEFTHTYGSYCDDSHLHGHESRERVYSEPEVIVHTEEAPTTSTPARGHSRRYARSPVVPQAKRSDAVLKRWQLLQSSAKTHSAASHIHEVVDSFEADKMELIAKAYVFTSSSLTERTVDVIRDLDAIDRLPGNRWIHVTEPHHDSVTLLALRYGFHHLVADQIADELQRPKLEEDAECTFIQVKLLRFDVETVQLIPIQVSIVLKDDLVLTFSEIDVSGLLKPIVDGLRAGAHVRSSGTDFIAYQIVDLIVDSYLVVLEELAESVEELEEDVMMNPTHATLQHVYSLKHVVMVFRRAVFPLRKIVHNMVHSETERFKPETGPYIHELYDHTMHVHDALETFRDTLTGMLDMYMSSLSNKTNDIMRVLAIVSTIFTPLTFLAGVYGMNFQYFPELQYKWSYPICIAVMVLMSAIMWFVFWRKKWVTYN